MTHLRTPSAAASLLLHAALAEPRAAASAWHVWRRGGGSLDDAAPELVRLLPLVHRNLPPDTAGPEDRGRLAGLRRNTWYRNQLRTRAASKALEALAAAGEPLMLLGGAAVAVAIPGGMGVRPLRDVDVLVPEAVVTGSWSALQALGLAGAEPSAPLRRVSQAAALTTPDGETLDVHWRPLPRAAPQASLWAAARPAELHGVLVQVPTLEDLVLHACVHASSPCADPVRWIADVALCVRAVDGGFSWERLVDEAGHHRAEVPVGAALELAGSFGVPVPGAVLAALRPARRPRATVLRERTAAAVPGRLAHHARQWERYRCDARERGERPGPRGYVLAAASARLRIPHGSAPRRTRAADAVAAWLLRR